MDTPNDQTSPDDLRDFLEANLGQPQRWPVSEDHIGGSLMSDISIGMYPNRLDFIREYVQNAVDGEAKKVQVKVTGNNVLISDDGLGMNIDQIHEARKIAVTSKNRDDHVGFRGIGIYSAFDICDKLIVTTKCADETKRLLMRFDFQGMRDQLESDPIPLTDLMYRYSTYEMKDEREDLFHRQYTIVQLENISDSHIATISSAAELERYLLKNLPIGFEEGFEHRDVITRSLRENVPGYRAVIVVLEIDGSPPKTIARPKIENLQEPFMRHITNSKGKKIAYYWSCLHRLGEQIPNEHSQYRGFVYKHKGFTIGDNDAFLKYFTQARGTLYYWYTGEVYVLDDSVIPNSARNGFEENSAKVQLETAVQEEFRTLQTNASDHRKRANANKSINEREIELEDIERQLENNENYDNFTLHRELQNWTCPGLMDRKVV